MAIGVTLRVTAAAKRKARQIWSGPKSLSFKQAHAIVARRMRKYEKFNFLESFAMFMGKAQIVELGMKNILTAKYGYDDERTERWTLGRVITELRGCGLREDFVGLIENLKDRRNYIAHEMLANDALLRRLAGRGAHRIAGKSLSQGLYVVETAIVVHNFLQREGLM